MRSHTSSRRRHARPGLTLVEVLVVLLVLAVAAGLAAPMFGGTKDVQLRGAARLLAADIDFARIESITHGDEPRALVLDPAGDRYHVALESDPDTPVTHPTTRTPYITRFGTGQAHAIGGVRISEHNLEDDRITFGIFGQLDRDDPAHITLTAGNRHITVTVDTHGEVSIGELL